MKRSFATLLLALLINCVEAQTAKDSVVATINNFFAGMKNADTVLLKSTLSSTIVLQTINDAGGTTRVKDEKISDFIGFVGQQAAGVADEQIIVESVKIDGSLASAWTPYKFYFKAKFSHCGVNSFQLVRINGQWKIQYIIDTRRKTDCL